MKRELSAFNGKKLSNNIDENIDLFSTIFEKDAAMRKREIIIGLCFDQIQYSSGI